MRKAFFCGLLFALPAISFAQSSAQIEANKGVLKVSPTVQLPSPCRQGQLWFDSTTNTPKTCNDGTNWTALGGGGIAPGAVTTCAIDSILWSDGTSLLACAASLVQNGSVSTAGRSILTIRDTISGASATSNFLNVTGTFPASLSADTNGVLLSIAGNGGSRISSALKIITSGSTAGGFPSYGLLVDNQQTGTYTIGVKGLGNAGASTAVGVIGQSTGATNKIGGYFALANQDPPSTSGALVIDNAAVAANIFEARDNGTAVWSIVDGGYIQGTMGEVALNADYTNATATFSSTALSVAVVSGRTYSFTMNLTFADSTAADGAQFDFNGGSAAATNFRVHCTASNAAGAALVESNAAATALATANAVTLALTTQANLVCNGTFVPSGNGTFIVRAAQSAHTAGTLTIHRGSWLSVKDARPL